MRQFLHFFGIHYWTDWSYPFLAANPDVLEVYCGKITVHMQKRSCKICEKIQRRRIK